MACLEVILFIATADITSRKAGRPVAASAARHTLPVSSGKIVDIAQCVLN